MVDKAEIAQRLGRSPDRGDPLSMSLVGDEDVALAVHARVERERAGLLVSCGRAASFERLLGARLRGALSRHARQRRAL